jgi:hypothetical protein
MWMIQKRGQAVGDGETDPKVQAVLNRQMVFSALHAAGSVLGFGSSVTKKPYCCHRDSITGLIERG